MYPSIGGRLSSVHYPFTTNTMNSSGGLQKSRESASGSGAGAIVGYVPNHAFREFRLLFRRRSLSSVQNMGSSILCRQT